MTNVQELIEKLRPIGERIQHWHAEAARIRAMTDETYASKSVEEARLQQVEEIAGQIYTEIETFDAIVAEISDASPAAAAELSDVGNALQLILLEITELGTGMYSVHSGMPIANPAQDGSAAGVTDVVTADLGEAEKSEAAPVSN